MSLWPFPPCTSSLHRRPLRPPWRHTRSFCVFLNLTPRYRFVPTLSTFTFQFTNSRLAMCFLIWLHVIDLFPHFPHWSWIYKRFMLPSDVLLNLGPCYKPIPTLFTSKCSYSSLKLSFFFKTFPWIFHFCIMFKLFREHISLNIDIEHESIMVRVHVLLKLPPLCRPVAAPFTLIMNPQMVHVHTRSASWAYSEL